MSSANDVDRPTLLMCRPDRFGVEYVINPWMEGNIGAVQRNTATRQWQRLHDTLSPHADIFLIDPEPGLPDMCFTANGGFAIARNFVPASFSVHQRRPESALHTNYFKALGYNIIELPEVIAFEGEGDALWWQSPCKNPVLWAGYGVRSSLEAHRHLAQELAIEVASLRLVDPRFYHLDTCFLPLANDRVVYYPPAFDKRSRELIEHMVAPDNRIEVASADGMGFACNAVCVGQTLVMNKASAALRKRLAAWGYDVVTVKLDQFIKAGGSAKCLSLRMEQDTVATFANRAPTTSPICSAPVEVRGHLLDSGRLNHVLDTIQDESGSFRLDLFRAGERRDQTSFARVLVSATNQAHLASILARLRVDETADSPAESDAQLVRVNQDGVAPDNFYCTTIYPTEVRIQSNWRKVQTQRMDAVITKDPSERLACTLIRDLKVGDGVVCGLDGIRVHMPDPRRVHSEFGFMSAGVSSERRVEGAIEELALEMRRIRDRNGRIVVVAGPVVIHTGSGPYLANLIKQGYVQALLSGNALAVHDIESNLFGTSLGVDLRLGVGVQGGHEHHLRAINRVRAAGSIREAVATGVVTGGIMYECVRHEIPFALAGSIRDDGPLPDTEMDLTAAQSAYAQLNAGADLVLMLSSMLHAIGTGNMTPAGVRLICVDINPAVVTKLADRGSIESTGIVTDVGLFLSQLDRLLG